MNKASAKHGLFFAPDLASAEISRISGNITTNAGGLHCIRNRVTCASAAALEVELADGSVLGTGARTLKNEVVLDLTSFFVGSEGILGVITAASVRLKQIAPEIPQTFRASFTSIDDARLAVTAIVVGTHTPEVLELMDARSVQFIEAYEPSGLPSDGSTMLIGQLVGLRAEKSANAIAGLCREHVATEAAVSEGDSLLETHLLAYPALNAQGLPDFCEVAVPIGDLAEMLLGIEKIAALHGRTISVVARAGDGNLHPTVEAEDNQTRYAVAELIIQDISRLALSLHGPISGERGIGTAKRAELSRQLNEATRKTQYVIKSALDPNNILTLGRAIYLAA